MKTPLTLMVGLLLVNVAGAQSMLPTAAVESAKPLTVRLVGLWTDASGKTTLKIGFLPDGSGVIAYDESGTQKRITFEWDVDEQNRIVRICCEGDKDKSQPPLMVNTRYIKILTAHYLSLQGIETGVFPTFCTSIDLKRVDLK